MWRFFRRLFCLLLLAPSLIGGPLYFSRPPGVEPIRVTPLARTGTYLTSDRLPALPGQAWAAEVRDSETGGRVVYIINRRPEENWVGAFLFAPLTLQIQRIWQSESRPAGDGFIVYVSGQPVEFIDYPWLIINRQITRLRRMPKPEERPIAVPSFETKITFFFPRSTGENDELLTELCCAACCAVHCTLLIPCSLDELCCRRQCGPDCWCQPICCITDSPRCF